MGSRIPNGGLLGSDTQKWQNRGEAEGPRNSDRREELTEGWSDGAMV